MSGPRLFVGGTAGHPRQRGQCEYSWKPGIAKKVFCEQHLRMNATRVIIFFLSSAVLRNGIHFSDGSFMAIL